MSKSSMRGIDTAVKEKNKTFLAAIKQIFDNT